MGVCVGLANSEVLMALNWLLRLRRRVVQGMRSCPRPALCLCLRKALSYALPSALTDQAAGSQLCLGC